MKCDPCRGEFTPRKPDQRSCTRRCAQRRLAKLRGRGYYRAKAKRAWTPEKRAKRQPAYTRTPEYKRGYQAGWHACEAFYRQAKGAAA